MDHHAIRHMLSEYIDGSVSAQEQAEIESHLKTCQQCSNALSELRKTIEHVKAVEEIEPPAWMSQKIMAQVRAETEGEKSWYQRIFYPLAVKLPIQAVAVLFLTVTAYYLYENINPAEKYPQTPSEVAAKKDSQSIDKLAKEEKILGAPAKRGKRTEQEAGYKALDMKNEYEKPAPPLPAEQPAAPSTAPAPAQRLVGSGAAAGASAAQERSYAAPAVAQNEAGRSEVAAKKAKTALHAMKQKAEAADEATKIHFIISVPDITKANKEVEGIVHELKGSVVRSEIIDKSRQISVSVNAKMLGKLQEKLGKLGEMKEKEVPATGKKGILQIEIKLTPAPHP